MPFSVPIRRFAMYAATLLTLLAAPRTDAQSQRGEPVSATPDSSIAAPIPILNGSGEQMRAIAAVCEAWEAAHQRAAKAGGKKTSPGGPQDSSDLRDYNFTLTEDATTYRIKLTPKRPAVEKVASPQGTYLLNNSSTFFYEVRRSDFKIVGVSAIL